MKNYLQRNKYSEVNITVHENGLHDEMKTSTEYRKRKHKITQDKDKQKVFSQSLQTDMNKHTTNVTRK